MAFVFILVSIILGTSAALPQDLSGQMLVFPEETYKAHVRLPTATQNLGAVTVCLRYLTDLTRGTTFFSLATPSHFNGFLIYKYSPSNEMCVYVRDARSTFKGQDFQLSRWQSVCSTWDAASGLVQLWLDGKPSSMKFLTNTNITGPMTIVLGQDQDSHGGGFVTEDSFVGMISDVHMWDHVLSPCHIGYYTQKQSFPVGNVLNWKSLEFQITGRVLVQSDQQQQQCWNYN